MVTRSTPFNGTVRSTAWSCVVRNVTLAVVAAPVALRRAMRVSKKSLTAPSAK
jgi:hypothetical protein